MNWLSNIIRVIIILLLISIWTCKPSNSHHYKIKAHPLSKEAPKIGYYAPNFIAINPKDKKISLEDGLGKATIIDFWASWCQPCREVVNPAYLKLYQKYHAKGLNIIMVSSDRHKYFWHETLKKDSLPWTHVLDSSKRILKMYEVKKLPTMFLVDRNGFIIGKNLWAENLENKIDSLVKLQ